MSDSIDDASATTDRARLFFATQPEPGTNAALAARTERLSLPAAARLVPRGNYHLTLAFLGEIQSAQMPLVRAIGAAQRSPAFTLRFDAYEYWPKPEVIVVTARAVPLALQNFWSSLHADLMRHQWALQPKRLRPHVTLVRKVAQEPVLPPLNGFEWPICNFCLMRSDTSGAHATYTVVDTWPLLDEPRQA